MRRKETEENSEKVDLKELLKTPRGKAMVFFGAYFVFFLIIAVVARTGGTAAGDGRNRKYQTGVENKFSFASIESNNYRFNYTVEIDGVNSAYAGVRTGKKEKITCPSLVEFYGEDGNYFTNTGGVWIKAENPFKFTEFSEVTNIKKLVEKATYMSNTSYESGKDVYNYNISSATISKLLDNQDIDIEEVPNEIIVSADKDNYVESVKYVLNSYCKVKGYCVNSMSITLNYELYGEIEEITSPLK